MSRLFVAVSAAVASVIFACPALAADLPVKAPVAVAPSYNWTGFYIGANVGGGWGNRNVDYTANDPTIGDIFSLANGIPPVRSFRTSGVLGGVQLGYNWQFAPTWLVGLETDFDWSGMKGSGSGSLLLGGTAPFAATADERLKWFGTVRARLGYLPANNVLAYVTGGFAYGRVEHTAAYISNLPVFSVSAGPPALLCAPNSACFAGSSSSVATGWTLGGGFEYAVAPKWTFKGEYLYVSLGGVSLTEAAILTPAVSFNANYGRTTFNVARLGVNYRF